MRNACCAIATAHVFVLAAGIFASTAKPVEAVEASTRQPIGWRSDGSGKYPDATPPVEWSTEKNAEKNIVWKTELPGRSYGSPIVVGDWIFVVSDPAELLCLRASDGSIEWQQSSTSVDVLGPERAARVAKDRAELETKRKALSRERNDLRKANPDAKEKFDALRVRHDEVSRSLNELKRKFPIPNGGGSGNSAGTPVCDGRNVYASYGSGIVTAHDLDGKRLWTRFVEGAQIGFGYSSSLLLVGEILFVHFQDLVALDATSGKELWRAELSARHASAIATRIGEVDVLITPSGKLVRASDGKVLLTDDGLRLSECSPVINDRIVYAQGGKFSAYRLPDSLSDDPSLELLWQTSGARGRRTPSPVYHDGLLYGATTEGIFDVTDASTGQTVYRKRLDLGKNLYASVTLAGDLIYLSSTQGSTLILKTGRKYEEVARCELESFGSCPVFIGKRMYVRGHKHLYCVGQ